MRFKTQEVFSVFGDFAEYVTGKEFPTDSLFKGYTKNVQEERLPNGDRLNHVRYTKNNLQIGIRPYRIDIVYGFNNQYCNDSDFMEETLKVLALFSNFEPGICGNRIALNVNEFLQDNDLEITHKLGEIFGTTALYGTADEFMLRLNNIKTLENEKFNSIMHLQNASVQNNQTKQTMTAMSLNTDINTVIENRNMRFDFDSLSDLLMAMVQESEDRKQVLFDKLGLSM